MRSASNGIGAYSVIGSRFVTASRASFRAMPSAARAHRHARWLIESGSSSGEAAVIFIIGVVAASSAMSMPNRRAH